MPAHNTSSDLTHWHILGAGAIGGLFSFWLKDRATLIINPNSTHAQDKKLKFTIEKNNCLSSFSLPCTQVHNANNIKNLLICTKAHQTQDALAGLVLNEQTNIVLLQNGMGNAELLKTLFPNCPIFCASTTHGAFRLSNTHIVFAGEGQTHLGMVEQTTSKKDCESVCNNLSTKKQRILFDEQMEKRLWIKLAMNCAINPLTAIYQCKNGELLEHEESLSHLKKICFELDKILSIKNYLQESENSFDIVKQVAQSTANNYSSMCQDHKFKRLSEIDFIQGYLLKEAQKYQLNLPENQSVFNTIKKIEAGY